jgi:two-component system response regulator QseB
VRILLAEDDVLLGDAIQVGLSYEGICVDWFRDGISAEKAIGSGVYDGAVLDICMPGQSGIEVLKSLRGRGGDLPVLMLTALGTVADRVTGLDFGADDYLVKPFDIDELLARLRALVRRSNGRAEPEIRHLDITIFPNSRTVKKSHEVVDLSRQEYLILQKLVENCGRIYSQQELTDYLYRWDQNIGSNTVQVYIHHLRKKLGKPLIKNRRGIGYVIEKIG